MKYFGTDGIRGTVGDTKINPQFFLNLGFALGTLLKKQATNQKPFVLIGLDTRVSGDVLQSALQAGFTAAGIDVVTLGLIPTPAVAYLTKSLQAMAGVVISASHNHYEDNGVKFFDASGMKFSDEMENKIEALLDQPLVMLSSEELGVVKEMPDARERYRHYCESIFPRTLKLSSLKIVVDAAHGAAYEVAPAVFQSLGATIETIGCQPNGININAHCGATDVRALTKKVLETQADLGIALDGDGDRLILVDHLGEIVDGDEILCILAMDSTRCRAQIGVVGTVMSNLGLEQSLQQKNIPFERAKVGDRFVLEMLLEKGWTLGGEASGHIVDLDYGTTGDGIITALQILRVMKLQETSLHGLKKTMTKRPQVLINVPVKKNTLLEEYPAIHEAVTAAELRLAKEGRILIRTSGTESCVRVMVEGNDQAQVLQTAQALAKLVEQQIIE